MNTEDNKEVLLQDENPFVPAPEGMLYATWDENYKLILENQIDAFEKGIKPVAYELAENGQLYVLGHAPKKTPKEKAEERIAELKEELNSTDYKIIKCSECSLAGIELPYNIVELHAQRQAIREEINKLEG